MKVAEVKIAKILQADNIEPPLKPPVADAVRAMVDDLRTRIDNEALDALGLAPKTPPTIVAPHFDFSKHRPGDVVCIPMENIQNWGQAQATMVIAAIANAAVRAGLDWHIAHSFDRNELRVSFSEPAKRRTP